MPDVTRLLPTPGIVPAAELVATLAHAQHTISPFHPEVVSFAGNLSRTMRRRERLQSVPAYAAAGYWLRPANISRLKAAWDRHDAADLEVVRAPRGVVFHVPPTNVTTLFVYSWVLSALAGNANVVRVSPRAVPESADLFDAVAEVIDEHPAVARTTALVTYDHNREITAALSQVDVRVLWGGDETINTLRSIPPAPRTQELVFPDRFSMALIDATTVDELGTPDLARLAALFYVDAYTFDQMACSSPRLVVWRGDAVTAGRASARFRTALLDEIRRRRHATATSTAIAKLVHAAAAAADGAVTSVDWSDNSLTIGSLTSLTTVPRDGPGGGLFYETWVEGLADIPMHLRRRDQTIIHYGLDRDAVVEFARLLGAHGVDRIVPVGSALTFDRRWDGHDLLLEFSRAIHVPTGAPA